jgi:glycosyltransferase 2 family protein
MKLLIKIFISLAMLILALRLVDINELKQSLLSIPLPTLGVVVVIFFFGQLLSSYKWWLLARSGSIEVPWLLAVRAYFLGMAVNCFGLGTVGGDLARALVLGSKSKQNPTALASVFADRVHGITVLAAIGVASMVFSGRQHIGSEYLVLLPVCIIAVVMAWYFGPSIALAVLPKGGALHRNMEQIAQVFPRDPATISYISLISLVFHLLQIGLHQVMAAGFGIQIPWPVLLVTIPVINILSSLPISWNGLGVRENGYVFFLAPLLLSREHAIAFGVMWLLATAISSAIGGLVLVFSKDLGWKTEGGRVMMKLFDERLSS